MPINIINKNSTSKEWYVHINSIWKTVGENYQIDALLSHEATERNGSEMVQLQL